MWLLILPTAVFFYSTLMTPVKTLVLWNALLLFLHAFLDLCATC